MISGRAIIEAIGAILAPDQSPEAKRRAPTAAGSLDDSWQELVRVAGIYSITPSLIRPLTSFGIAAGLDTDLVEYLTAVHELNADRNRLLLRQAEIVTGRLNRAGIQPVFLKGMALLLQGLYSDVGTRFMRDIDLLVPRSRLRQASALLQEIGYKAYERDEEHDGIRMTHPDYPSMVEIHRALLPERLNGIAPAALVLRRKRAVPSSVLAGGFTPHPTHLVIHNVAHAMLHDRLYARAELPLKDAYDLALLAHRYGDRIAWDEVSAALAGSAPGAAVLGFYGNATRTLFGAVALPAFPQPPEAILTRWRWWRRGGRPADLVTPRSPARNLGEIGWRCLVVPDTRERVSQAVFRPGMYPAYYRKLRRIARRHDGISSI